MCHSLWKMYRKNRRLDISYKGGHSKKWVQELNHSQYNICLWKGTLGLNNWCNKLHWDKSHSLLHNRSIILFRGHRFNHILWRRKWKMGKWCNIIQHRYIQIHRKMYSTHQLHPVRRSHTQTKSITCIHLLIHPHKWCLDILLYNCNCRGTTPLSKLSSYSKRYNLCIRRGKRRRNHWQSWRSVRSRIGREQCICCHTKETRFNWRNKKHKFHSHPSILCKEVGTLYKLHPLCNNFIGITLHIHCLIKPSLTFGCRKYTCTQRFHKLSSYHHIEYTTYLLRPWPWCQLDSLPSTLHQANSNQGDSLCTVFLRYTNGMSPRTPCILHSVGWRSKWGSKNQHKYHTQCPRTCFNCRQYNWCPMYCTQRN